MEGALGLLVALGAVLLVVAVVMLAARAVTVQPRVVTVLPFESGWRPREHALSRFHARWYPLSLLLLAFDVEMLFMFPWSVVAATAGVAATVEMFVFLGVLVAATVWAWREGTLRWV